MTVTLSWVGVQKELRALLGPWLLVLTAVVAAGLTEDGLVPPVAAAGCIGLGAWSLGHEYSYRTLQLLLAQPRDRRSLWLDKAVVLGPLLMMVFLTAVRFVTDVDAPLVIGGGVVAALTLAPWMTMVSRSARGGVFFTLATLLLWIIGGIWAGETIAVRFPEAWPDPFAFIRTFVESALLALFVVTGALAWRTFQFLNAIDERADHLTLPDLRRASARAGARTAARRPVAALFRKELGLQAPVFVVSSVYVLALFGSWMLRPSTREALIMVATLLHGGIVPLLAGSMASAEERRMGTLPTQLLQPVSAGAQWAVKAAVVIGLTVLLAVGLPVVFQWLDTAVLSGSGMRQLALGLGFYRLRSMTSMILVITMLAALSLYVSSLARNSLHALLASIAAGVVLWNGLAYGLRLVSMADSRVLMELLRQHRELIQASEVRRAFLTYSREITRAYETLTLGMIVLMVVGGLWLFLRFGNENHRFSDHRFGQIAIQVMVILLVPVVALAFYHGLPALIFGG